MDYKNTTILDQIIEQSLRELSEDFKRQNGVGGWHQFFSSPKIGNVATSQGLLLLKQFAQKFKYSEEAIAFLISQQKKSDSIHINGGWSYITNLSDISNTESTCWVLQALYHELPRGHEVISSGIQWLIDNFNGRNNDCKGWGSVIESEVRTYSTCIALRTLKLLGQEERDIYRQGMNSLKRLQNIDGGWGESASGASTLSHTSHCIIALIDLGLSIKSKEVARGVEWILLALEKEFYETDRVMGFVEIVDLKYSVGGQAKEQRITFYHMPMSYGILALIKARIERRDIIFKVIMYFIQQQKHGHWLHPYLPNQLTLWSMYDVLTLFFEFRNSAFVSDFDHFTPKLKFGEKIKFDVIVFTIVPVEFTTLNKILKFAPNDRKEDYAVDGFWYYKHTIRQDNGHELSCLITMVGTAGDVDCTIACSTTFQQFDCDIAILLGIAAGNRSEIKKYDSIFATDVIAYEYQRWSKDGIDYRPKPYTVNVGVRRLLEKSKLFLDRWNELLDSCLDLCEIDFHEVEGFDSKTCELKVAAIASGAKLLADGNTLEILKKEIPIGKGIIAAEMEGSGFAPACIEKHKNWLIIRGISDYGEDDKNQPLNKTLQPLAVASATASLLYFLTQLYRKPD